MSTPGLVFTLILVAVALACVLTPLIQRGSEGMTANALASKRRERLLVYYQRVLTNIRDLDEDLATGKITDAEHASEREGWVQCGVQALRALDSLEPETPIAQTPKYDVPAPEPRTDVAAIDRIIDDEIEAAISAYRKK